MMPINVMYVSSLDSLEKKAIEDSLAMFRRQFPTLEVNNYKDMSWSAGDYSSANWYVAHAKRIGSQIDATSLNVLMVEEPWQKRSKGGEPHIDVLFVKDDLTVNVGGGYLHFCFGVTQWGQFIVDSVYRFKDLPNDDRYMTIKAVMLHELGHALGMAADPKRSNTEENIGRHCTNHGCIMKQGLSVPAWTRNAREAFAHGIYCPQCLADARQRIARD